MPLAQDLLTRIVNVHWGGGVFVAAGGFIYYGEVSSQTNQEWQELGTLDFRLGAANDSAFARVGKTGSEPGIPTFVLAGRWDDGTGTIGGGTLNSGDMILASNDGKSWTVAYQTHDISIITPGEAGGESLFQEVKAVVWDATAVNPDDPSESLAGFFAVSIASRIKAGVKYVEEVLLRSPDGFAFSEVDRKRYDDDNWSLEPSAIGPHCIKPSNKGGIPDGYQAYNDAGPIFIKPKDLKRYTVGGLRYLAEGREEDVNPTSSKLTITVGTAESHDANTTEPCYAVALSSGIYAAACGPSIDVAFGEGTFESAFFKKDERICTICAKQ